MINTSTSHVIASLAEHGKRLFVKNLKILCSSGYLILFKYIQLVVNIVIKELQIVFWTSTGSNINRNMEELERKI